MNGSADTPMSVLFAGVTGSARLHEKLGGNEAQWAIDRCLKRMERAIDAFGGKTVKAAGDELMAVFQTADAAFHSAIDMLQRVDDLPPVSGLKLEIRIGFTYGPARIDENNAIGDAVSEAAWLAGIASPGQILTSSPLLKMLSPALQASTRPVTAKAFRGKQGDGKVCEVLLPGMTPVAPKPAPVVAAASTGLILRHEGNEMVLDGSRGCFSLGRDSDCDLVANGSKVSRVHAVIEFQGSRFVLIDKSTNGTFIKTGREPELALHHQEAQLRGKGVIGLAHSTRDPETDRVEFEVTGNGTLS